MKLQNVLLKMSLTACLAITTMVAAGNRLHAGEPVDVFDGNTLSGWQRRQAVAEFRVEDGMIIGKTVKNAGNTFLCTTLSRQVASP